MSLTVQPDIILHSADNLDARYARHRESQACYRTDAGMIRQHLSPDAIHPFPIKIDDAHRIFAKNLDARRTICLKIGAGHKLEQRKTIVRHDDALSGNAKTSRPTCQSSMSFYALPLGHLRTVDCVNSLHCSGNNSVASA